MLIKMNSRDVHRFTVLCVFVAAWHMTFKPSVKQDQNILNGRRKNESKGYNKIDIHRFYIGNL